MAGYPYQNVNFHFSVDFYTNDSDIRFQSVTGLDSVIETEPVKEGGQNQFTHLLPVRRKYGPVVLKRGLLSPDDSPVTQWLKSAFDDQQIVPKDTVVIKLLDEDHKPLIIWNLNHVWPLSWKIAELNAEQGAILIESLELSYNSMKMTSS